MRKVLGLRSEILISLSVLVVSGLLFAGLFLLKIAENELIEERIQTTLSSLQGMTALVRVDHGGLIFLQEIDWLFRQMNLAADAAVYTLVDAEVQRRAGQGPELADPADLRRTAFQGTSLVRVSRPAGWYGFFPGAAGGYFDVYQPLVFEGSIEGVLFGRFSLNGIAQRMVPAQTAIFVLIFGFGGVLIAFGTYVLGRSVVLPARRLMQATSRVAAGDLGVNVPVDGPREISELAASFNAMTRALQESRAQTQETIAGLHQANAELEKARRHLVRSEKMAAVGNLAAGIAHEIGNPLGAALGYLDLAQAGPRSPETEDLLARAGRELRRIDLLVRDLLDFASPRDAAPEVLEPVAVAREAAQLLEHQGIFQEVGLENVLPPRLPEVLATRHKLLQVLVNLLLNARDACIGNGGRVRLEGKVVGGEICLIVRDEGPGLPPGLEERIFDPFFTTKEPGKGRGLGLFFCHKVIEESGGRMEVSSRPGEGACFQVFLPVAGEDARHV
ncbi:sensor histidine kinase [Geoalkalibacter sp.]|uniref:sensor histidine kinase n=1 Tax=Geoalkalibacter sp. TaxID=3041440 RepID=UPI00272ED119|nr:sensor histidine kinase [Geoalkalibacter sp.]